MQDLRIILIILGAVAIAALLIHGLWTSQKGRQKPLREKPLSKVGASTQDQTDNKQDQFDSDGIGRVRVAGSHQAASLSRDHEIEDDWQISANFSTMSDDDLDEPSIGLPPTLSSSVFAEDADDELSEAYASEPSFTPRTPAKPERAAQTASRQPPKARGQESSAELRARQYRQGEIDPLFDNHTSPASVEPQAVPDSLAIDEPPLNALGTEQAAPEPMVIEPQEPAAVSESPVLASAPAEDAMLATAPEVVKTWQDVYVISLVAKPNQVISGTDLMRAVTEVGFIYGDMDIFHRYQGSSTQGEALFSLANLVNPGTFTPDAMSEFTTPGVSIFMQLPKPGTAKNNFNMMIQAAGNMAENLDAVLLDGQRQTLGLDYLVRCRAQLNDFDSQA